MPARRRNSNSSDPRLSQFENDLRRRLIAEGIDLSADPASLTESKQRTREQIWKWHLDRVNEHLFRRDFPEWSGDLPYNEDDDNRDLLNVFTVDGLKTYVDQRCDWLVDSLFEEEPTQRHQYISHVLQNAYYALKRMGRLRPAQNQRAFTTDADVDWQLAHVREMLEDDTGHRKRTKSTRPPKWDAATEARNKWCYDECCKGTLYKTIIIKLAKKPKSWERLNSIQAVKRAANAYAERFGLPRIPGRQRPRRLD